MLYDFAIIGAGPAGSLLATHLARAGRSVWLAERDTFPRDKLCGEYLSGEAVAELERAGMLPGILARAPPRVTHALFTLASGESRSLELPAAGLGLSRRALDALLFEHAARAGANCSSGAEVTGFDRAAPGSPEWMVSVRTAAGGDSIHTRVLIGAYGRRASLDHALRRPYLARRHPLLALSQHCVIKNGAEGDRLRGELASTVAMHFFPGGYAGLTFIEDGRINLCALVHRKRVRGAALKTSSDVLEFLSTRSPHLARACASLAPDGAQPLITAAIPLGRRAAEADGVLFLGDAAGMLPPMVGGGQANALRSARELAELCLSKLCQPEFCGPLPHPELSAAASQLANCWRAMHARANRRRFTYAGILHAILTRRRAPRALFLLARGCSAQRWPLRPLLARVAGA